MKLTNRPQYILIAVGALVMAVAFQNMSYIQFSRLRISEVDETNRLGHARELLGNSYKGSDARKMCGEAINFFIYQKVEKGLDDEKWAKKIPQIVEAIISQSQAQDLDPTFTLAVIQTESQFNSDAVGTSGEIGLMQILPNTAEWIARLYKIPWKGKEALFDPVYNVKIGTTYFAHLRSEFDGLAYYYLPAYNMGPKNLRRIERSIGSIDSNGNVMKREYAVKVIKNYYAIYQDMHQQQKTMERICE
ncbi:MAG: lytic transglycosylase domain-containing protein [Bdellovibrionota bacterium]